MDEEFLRQLFAVAVSSADPMKIIPHHLPPRPRGRVLVLGAGKASARMAEAVEQVWGSCEGLVITRYGYARACKGIEIVEAAHPVPDAAGLAATQRLLELATSAQDDDFVLALISGGASALMIAPLAGMTLADKQAVNAQLLASGAPIGEMNIVRKHLSRVKGGRLAAAVHPAKMLALMISDVPGDDPALIGSGPTVGHSSTIADALAIMEKWKIAVPAHVAKALRSSVDQVTPASPLLSSTENRVIAAPSQSLEAAARLAESQGFDVRILGDRLEGEARDVAVAQAALALSTKASLQQGSRPVLLLSGGELTVTRRGDGIGGPNAEFMLALAVALDGAAGIHALACDTDGVDGAADVAGAVISPATLATARAKGLDAQDYLARNDSHSFFERLGSQVVTGPTLTNVNDFRAILIRP